MKKEHGTIKYWLASFGLFFNCLNGVQGNELQKIFHHRSDPTVQSVELGKVVFYFSNNPIINQLPTHDGTHSLTFFFPSTKINTAAVPALMALNNQTNDGYTMHLDIVRKPIKGIKFQISFDPKEVSFEYGSFDSIGLQKGIVFRFFNKTFLHQLNKQDRSVLKLVCAKKKPSIVIDCGHGGKDEGAVGFFDLKEKDLTMNVGLHVSKMLKDYGFDVFLTRSSDATLALDERTTLANISKHAGLLVSIHANFSANKDASGVETFCLHPSLIKQNYCGLNESLADLAHSYTNSLYKQSSLLAHAVQSGALASIKKKQHSIVDRKVKNSVSQMLIGTTMPSALIEIGFISNKNEAKLLASSEYQQLVAQGICNGIVSYLALNQC